MFPEHSIKTIFTAKTRFALILRVCQSFNKPAIIFPLAILIFVNFGCRMFQSSPHKTDAQLTTEFQQNKEKFNRLVSMVKEDKIQVSTYEIEKGLIKKISSSRVEEYKKLLEGLNLLIVIPNRNEKESAPVTRIYLKSSSYIKKGEYICQYSEDKGFMWHETGNQPANREARNLDWEYTKGGDVEAESRIDSNWSLYYAHETCVKD